MGARGSSKGSSSGSTRRVGAVVAGATMRFGGNCGCTAPWTAGIRALGSGATLDSGPFSAHPEAKTKPTRASRRSTRGGYHGATGICAVCCPPVFCHTAWSVRWIWPPVVLFTVAAALLPTCSASSYPERTCSFAIWARPASVNTDVYALGSWDDFREAVPMPRYGDGWHMTRLNLPPGEHAYFVVEDGVRKLDAYNPLSTWRGDDEASLALVPSCQTPEVQIDSVEVQGTRVSLSGTLWAVPGGAALSSSSIQAKTDDGRSFSVLSSDPETGKFALLSPDLPRGRYALTVTAADEDGLSASAKTSAFVEPQQAAWDQGLLYQVVIDRFRGDDGAPLAPPSTLTSRAGGTLYGVLSELKQGTFDALGVTALWLSPVYLNPDEPREGRDGHPTTGYHGYWPLESRQVDPKIGGEAALRAVVAEAHARGIKVLLDLVPNHVYEANPRYLEHQGTGWFNEDPAPCVCGTSGCSWATHIQSCWFTDYLPDVRWQDRDALSAELDDTRFWAETFGVDGFRIDAVPMMPRGATRRLAHMLRSDIGRPGDYFLLGEVFTGSGQEGIDDIRYFLGPSGLDSAFDFPVMWALRSVVAHGTGSFADLTAVLDASEVSYAGSGAVRGLMLGNHDTTRFLSEANGDAASDAWLSPPAIPSDPDVYARHRLGLALVLTLGQMPVLYYGDEVGLPGASDPDCRRVLPAWDALSDQQEQTLAVARRLGTLRRCSKAMQSGARKNLASGKDSYIFVRNAGLRDVAIVLVSRATTPVTLSVNITDLPSSAYVDALSGETFTPGAAGLDIAMEPLSFRVLLPEDDACLSAP